MTKTITILLAAASSLTGCFTTWGTIRATGKPGAWDEHVREERVPLPGVEERLTVSLSMAHVNPSGFSFECKTTQQAREIVYHSAFRYGSGWKKGTAVMFLAEAALGTALLLAGDNKPQNLAVGGFLALDAIGTGVLFFVPRKEIYQRAEAPVTTQVRDACPDNLALEIGGDTFPIDAAGGIGELGAIALDEWMRESTGSMAVTFDGRASEVRISDLDRCSWQRARNRGAAAPTSSAATAATSDPAAPASPASSDAYAPAPAPSYAPAATSYTPSCAGVARVLGASFDLPAGTTYSAITATTAQ